MECEETLDATGPALEGPVDDEIVPLHDAATATADTIVPEEKALAGDVAAWLAELRLPGCHGAVLEWCEEMGAITLEEVVDCAADIVHVLESREDLATAFGCNLHRLSAEGVEALAAVRNPRAKSSKQSFYAPAAGREDGEVYLKSRPTERATWEPTQKTMGQADRKKQHRQRIDEATDENDGETAKVRAAELFRKQLEDERRRREEEALVEIRSAEALGEPDALREAIARAEVAGLAPAEDIAQAKQSLQSLLRRQRHRNELAACKLQAALEASRGSGFGSLAREALEGAREARQTEHGPRLVDAVEAAVREWEVTEQLRDEANMMLHYVMQRPDVKALLVAVEEATRAGCPSGDDTLLGEAQRTLARLLEKEAADAAAYADVERALEVHGPGQLQELEAALAACAARQLPLRGDAEAVLERLRAEAARRAAAAARLASAMRDSTSSDSENIALELRAAAAEARQAGLDPVLIEEAESRARELKQRQNAAVELSLACTAAVQPKRLEAAIAEGRRWDVDVELLETADKALAEAHDLERRRDAARTGLEVAMRRGEEAALWEALAAAEHALLASSGVGADTSSLERAQEMLGKLQEEAQLVETVKLRKTAEVTLRAALDRSGDSDAIEAAAAALRAAGAEENDPLLQEASMALKDIQGERETLEARRVVDSVERQLEDLKCKEASLIGAVHKKERAAIGKQILTLKNEDGYLSAVRFLRNPDEERERRHAARLELDARDVQLAAELRSALSRQDYVGVRAVLDRQGGALQLEREQTEAAARFLADCDRRHETAARDAAILEFVFAGFDRRAFFQAPVAMNELFTERYAMQESVDFKIKVVKSANSVLVAFRSLNTAEAVRRTLFRCASELGTPQAAILTSAIVNGGANGFSDQAQDYLPAIRQEAEAMQLRPAREEPARVLRELESSLAAPASHTPPASQSVARAVSGRPLHASAPPSSSAPASLAGEFVLRLSRQTAGFLQHDRMKAASFHNDLREFGKRFKVSAEMRGEDAVALTADAHAHQESLRLARAELERLVDHYFPEKWPHQHAPQAAFDSVSEELRAAGEEALLNSAEEGQQRRRRVVRLNVDPHLGAGVELTATPEGYLVDLVEDHPGQNFKVSDLLVAIADNNLVGLGEKELFTTFGEHFADGVQVMVLSATSREHAGR